MFSLSKTNHQLSEPDGSQYYQTIQKRLNIETISDSEDEFKTAKLNYVHIKFSKIQVFKLLCSAH